MLYIDLLEKEFPFLELDPWNRAYTACDLFAEHTKNLQPKPFAVPVAYLKTRAGTSPWEFQQPQEAVK